MIPTPNLTPEREAMLQNDHLTKLLNCYDEPPRQEAVGSSPEKFILELGELYTSSLSKLPHRGKKRLNRAEVRKVCEDEQVDDLVAYCVVMRWGGRNPQNFRLSIADGSRLTLEAMLKRLRGSTRPRSEDFAKVKEACRSIRGLGISFYTKLLFFFRAKEDAYILDQWTAKSARLIFDLPPVELANTHFPSSDTTPQQYEDFCTKLEDLRDSFSPPWATGEEVERAVFSAPGKPWRLHVKGQFPTTSSKTPKSGASRRPNPSEPCSHQAKLAVRIANLYEEKAKEGISLPSDVASVTDIKGYPRVNCFKSNGLTWQYRINKGSIAVEAQLYQQTSDLYQTIETAFGVSSGRKNFGNGITGNGSKVIRIKFEADVSDEQQWAAIAQKAVEEMNRLHEEITAVLG